MTLRQELDALPDRARNIARHAETALRELRDAIDQHDGFSDHTVGASVAPGTPPPLLEGTCHECGNQRPCPDHDTHVPLTSVERAAGHLSPLLTEWNHLTRVLAELLGAMTAAEKAIARRSNPPKPERCNRGTGREGQVEWADPLCDKYGDPALYGMDDDCWRAEERWRRSHGLEPRERKIAVAPGQAPCVTCGHRDATPGRTDGDCSACRMSKSRARRVS